MSEQEQTYDEGRSRNLEALLVALAERILELKAGGALLSEAHELMKLIGDIRSELFHYEVRATYDTPEIAESRRIVEEAERHLGELGLDEPDDDQPWRRDDDG